MAINTHCGLFKVNRLQQGIKTAPGIFQQIVNTMLSGMSTFGFIDDMIVAGEDEEDHRKQLCKTLSRLQEYGFKLSTDKCEFGKDEVKFCGHIVNHKGIRPDPENLLALRDLPRPTDISQLRAFLGAINYYGKFVARMKELRAPLNNVLKSKVKYQGIDAHEKAFLELKDRKSVV